MADEGFKRKLAAILSADVVGYSLLMDNDEEATVRTLKSYRAAINDLVQQYRGRVVDSPGDNLLAEFNSVVDAVNCAVEIHRELAKRNADLAYNRRMEFRIGVNLGDVIDDDGNIYGDGVNIAARVESLAEAGGICLSGRAHDQVENKLGLEYEDLGKHEVKNISKPIQVYRVLSYPGAAAHRVVKAKESLGRKWRNIAISTAVAILIIGGLAYWQFYMRRPSVEPASLDKMAFPLPEEPSIAVLPFVNMSEDPKQEYLSDGITEQIITTLSKVPSMFVIARTSTFAYKDKSVKVQQVSEELGVRYVLEGSIQRSEDRIRITAQLIDAIDGKHMWAQRYDRELKDIFKLQDEITLKIIRALQVKLTEGEEVNIWDKNQPSNVEYIEKVFEARSLIRQYNKESNHRVKQLSNELIELEPENWWGYLGLATANNQAVWLGMSSSPRETLGQAFKLCQKAISLDETQDLPHMLAGNIYLLMRKYDLSIKELKRAIALNPNSATAYVYLGQSLSFSGRPEEGIELIKKGMRLSPFPNSNFIANLAFAYRENGRYEEAIAEYRRCLNLAPNNILANYGLSLTYALAGRFEESREAYSELLKIDPDYSFESGLRRFPYRPERIKVVRAAIQKAGLPFEPPLPLPDKPSIAVLAFDNLSGDPEQEYFSDGIAENIITALSKVGGLFVIARNSSFTYKGKPVKVQQVSRELGVRYILEGSIQKSGERVRITAQLIDATNGQHIWAEKYDRNLEDIFEIQDEITKKIVTGMQVNLTEGEQARLFAKQTKNLDVYLKYMQLLSLANDGTKESIMRAGEVAQEIINIEPDNPLGYRMMGWYHRGIIDFGFSPKENLEKAFIFGKKALEMDESDGFAHALLGHIYNRIGKHEKAIESGKRSVELQPNGALVHNYYALALDCAGHFDEAITYSRRAIRLNPFPPHYYYQALGRTFLKKGQYENALEEFEKALQRAPESPWCHFDLAIIYIFLGRNEEARASAAKCMELAPYITVGMFPKPRCKGVDKALFNKWLDAMRKAGFPE